MNEHMQKVLKNQRRVYENSLKNLQSMAIKEALDFIKYQSGSIQKHLTTEHHKLVEKFQAFKDRTDHRLKRAEIIEKLVSDLELRYSLESATKEAMYAMDATNPLRLFDCLIPELTAYRPLRLPLDESMYAQNYIAMQQVKETELKILNNREPLLKR